MTPGASAWRALWPVLPLLAFLVLVVVGPIARVLLWGLAPSMAPTAPTETPWRELAATPLYREALLRTFRLSLTVTLACLVLGYPVAYASPAPGDGAASSSWPWSWRRSGSASSRGASRGWSSSSARVSSTASCWRSVW